MVHETRRAMAAPSAKRIALITLASAVPLDAIHIRSDAGNLLEYATFAEYADLETVHKEYVEYANLGSDPAVNDSGVNPEEKRKESEMEIFNKHWWPLEPPPYHHPGKNPKLHELRTCQALETNYTSYWRSLPKFEPSPVLDFAQRFPYIKISNWTSALHMTTRPGTPDTKLLEVLVHHKTGENLRTNIENALPKGSFNLSPLFETFWLEADETSPGRRRLHFIRDPIKVILSGYRYHQHKWGSEVWDWGHGRLQDPHCFQCDDQDHYAMFASCSFNCTYFELLNRLDEGAGVVVEAISARNTLMSMATLMGLLGNSSDTLHLSMDLFKGDSNRTTACLLKFLGLDGNTTLQNQMVKAVSTVVDPDHVTSGHYDNAALEAMLRNHPTWGPEFREINELKAKIFRRQAALWGCPEQEAAL